MKILKIFGLVVGVHVIAFMFVFAIPGCRSTSRHSPPPSEATQADRAQVRAAKASPITDGTNTPLVANSVTSETSPVASPVSGNSSSLNFSSDSAGFPVVHSNPTRPGSAEAASLITPPAPTTTPATTYVVVSGDSLWKIAKKHGMSSKEIAAANNLRTDAPLREGQKLIIPGKAIPHSTASALPTSNPAETLTYRVKSGETLAVIARHSGTTTAAIKSLNHLKSDNVHVGQELVLPAGGSAATTLAATEDTSGHGKNAGSLHHTVKAGETLGQIAKHYGVSRRELAVANNIADPLKLRAGQDLVIPGKAGNGPAAKNGATAAANSAPAETSPVSNNAPAPANNNFSPVESPIAPATSSGQTVSPETSPIAPATPPVIQVQDSNNPVSSK
ncbi:MAG TPA: LysM peptidoglycan-binding domain-containing protein [Opitutaceae bacterium]